MNWLRKQRDKWNGSKTWRLSIAGVAFSYGWMPYRSVRALQRTFPICDLEWKGPQ